MIRGGRRHLEDGGHSHSCVPRNNLGVGSDHEDLHDGTLRSHHGTTVHATHRDVVRASPRDVVHATPRDVVPAILHDILRDRVRRDNRQLDGYMDPLNGRPDHNVPKPRYSLLVEDYLPSQASFPT